MIPIEASANRVSPTWRRRSSSRDRGIMWLTLVGSPVSG
jgi:hypothetical protein